MSTQGILISGNSNVNSSTESMSKNSRGRAASAVPALNLGSGQENRNAPESTSLSHRVKSPSSKLKSQIISPRFSISKIDPILISSKKSNSSTTTPRETPGLNRRESSNNLKNFFKPIGSSSNRNSNGGSGHSATMNTKGSISTNPISSNQNNTVKVSTNHMGVNLRTNSHTMARTATASTLNNTNNKAMLRSNSSFSNNSFKNGARMSSNSSNQPPRSPPPLSHDHRTNFTPTVSVEVNDLPSPTLIRTNSKDNLKTKSIIAPDFPPAPDNPEKQFIGTDKLAYKIWMKERLKYDKWESAKKLYQTKYAEGNVSACQRIVDRLNSELEDLTKSIREVECKRMFPEEPIKPSEICPNNNPKEAKVWQQQKLVYEAWENAFNLFQENMAKGDTAACKKLIDVLQMTIYNPQFNSEMPASQPNTSRRGSANNPQITPKIEPSDQSSKVKFAVAEIPINLSNPPQNGLPKSRPKLQPPASWTKPRSRENQEDKKLCETRKTNSDSSVDPTQEQVYKDEVMEPTITEEEIIAVHRLHKPTSSTTSTSSDLIEAIDSVLAELDSNNFFNPKQISS